MATLFGDIHDATARMLLDTHGETVTFRPRVGPPRTVLALVNRQPYGPMPESSETMSQAFALTFRNVAASVLTDGYGGITTDEWIVRGATVDVPRWQGGPTQRMFAGAIASTASGMIVAGVRL